MGGMRGHSWVGRERERRRGNFFFAYILFMDLLGLWGMQLRADFKHYLILQTSLLMCGDQRQRLPNEDWGGEEEGGGGATTLMRMTVAFQSKSRKVLLT